MREDNLSGERRAYLLRLLEIGVSDYQYNSAAAWAALQRHDVWPEEAEAALWRGILRSALFGFTLREEDYRPQFDTWQELHHDQGCEDIIAMAMSYMAMEI